ncbi:prepilin-type N-terminal cleavage/methylation domain-containing protein [Epsilonproteobacteria bacterium SCGC AD-311-C15]|jgi:prepilin-type N-terminal cleavage/methylation domain-containing protein|nr:prepilin-type N-terminal cleavage/methylation domain-containing protein [Epsilonproteobacteria bacterium SCGC AD-311-C15]
MNKKTSKAFTMIELIFVIVIMGILAKFGVEFLAQAYNSFIHSKINNELQGQSETAVEFVANRLQYRIKDSVIARESNNSFNGLSGYSAGTAPILEWVGSDVEGFRGDSLPYWSGVIDFVDSNATLLKSPETNTTAIDALIKVLADNPATSTTTIDDAALYFVDSDNDVINGYGWTFSSVLTDQNGSVIHPIKAGTNPDEFVPRIGGTTTANTFTNVDVSDYYKLAWTAYAVGISDYNLTGENTGTLMLYYDYQPWDGENYLSTETKSQIIMQNVSTFQFMAVGSLVKIQVCVKSNLLKDENGEYSICKEKTIY